MEVNIFLVLILIGGVISLFYIYGHYSWLEGNKKGYSKGRIAGETYGAESCMLLQEIKLINIIDLEKRIMSGEFDHIQSIKKTRNLMTK